MRQDCQAAAVITFWTIMIRGWEVRNATATMLADARFDLPPAFVVADRRMAGQALDRWLAGGGGLVTGFEAHSLVVVDPAGLASLEIVGDAVGAAFGLAARMPLDGRTGLAAEIHAACKLIALDPRPVPFEANLGDPRRALVLLRGIALPIGAAAGKCPDRVQVIVNWREVLDRAATTRLRRELGTALRLVPSNLARIDPFSPAKPR